jgi:hypothetical protein
MISISIWICNPVRIYGRKINDDDDDGDIKYFLALLGRLL